MIDKSTVNYNIHVILPQIVYLFLKESYFRKTKHSLQFCQNIAIYSATNKVLEYN